MLQKYIVFTKYTNQLCVHRYFRTFDKLINHRHMLSTQQSMIHQSRHYQSGSLAARLQSHLNSRNGNLSKINELILRRNFCTKPSKRSERNWSSVRKQHQQSKKEIRRLFSLAKDEKWYLIAAVGCLLVSSVVTLGVPRAIGKLMDMIVADGFPKEKLNTFCVVLFGIFVAGGLANFGRIYLMNSASKQMINLNENSHFKFNFFLFSSTSNCEGSSFTSLPHNVKSRARMV